MVIIMKTFSLRFVLSATSGSLTRACYNMKLSGISTDSRTVEPGCLYLALRGDRFDGHDYISAAFDKGALAAVAERVPANEDRPVMVVKDTHQALLDLAAAYRRRFDIPVVGVTGSVGKTSTKEMICAVLSTRYRTLKNEGNRNNEIGMPLSVFNLEDTHQAAVFEMGMSAFGEIARMTRVAVPQVAVITNIGISHIEKLGSRENILRAKLEILEGMPPDGTLIYNGDDELLCGAAKQGLRVRTLCYGIDNPGCTARAANLRIDEAGTAFDLLYAGKSYPAWVPASGRHQVYNALAAFLAGVCLGVEPMRAVEGLRRYRTTGMRQRIEEIGGITFVEDCYNASPDSMRAAFGVLGTVAKGRKVAVLSDMLELGDHARESHLAAGRLAAESGVDMLLCYGDNARFYCEGFRQAKEGADCRHFDTQAELSAAVSRELGSGDTVLFKASRGMKLEDTVADAARAARENGGRVEKGK